MSVDPLTASYPSWTPYAFAMNRPIDGVDLDGLEWREAIKFGKGAIFEYAEQSIANFRQNSEMPIGQRIKSSMITEVDFADVVIAGVVETIDFLPGAEVVGEILMEGIDVKGDGTVRAEVSMLR